MPRRRPRPTTADDAVLVTGATGCIGSALVHELLADGRDVRCLVRDPDRLDAAFKDEVWVVVGDVEDRGAVERASRTCSVAYYLVHGLDGPLGTLVARESRAATAFRSALERGGVGRIVYLGGLVDEGDLARTSEHLYARQQVGEELRAGTVEVTELRAGIVLARDSASVALLLAAARSPIQVWGAWAASKVQPIALADVIEVLVACADDPRVGGAVLDIGGPDVLTYEELVEQVREVTGRARGRRLRLPYLPIELAAPAAAARAGVDAGLTLSLLQSVRGDAIVRDPAATALFPGMTATASRAALTALVRDG